MHPLPPDDRPPQEEEVRPLTRIEDWCERAKLLALGAGTIPVLAWKQNKGGIVLLGVLTGTNIYTSIVMRDWNLAMLWTLLYLFYVTILSMAKRTDIMSKALSSLQRHVNDWDRIGDDLLTGQTRKSAVGLTFRACAAKAGQDLSNAQDQLIYPAFQRAVMTRVEREHALEETP